jgi:Uncharacterized protein conserved in bacteria
LLKCLLGIFLFLLLVILLLQTAPVQNFARKKVQAYLTEKLNTRVEIGRIQVQLPATVLVEKVYVEDLQNDTLLYGGRLQAGLNLFRLIRNEIKVSEIHLEDITVHINRKLPDTVFNFQFIVDAFASENEQPATTDTSAMKMEVKRILLNDIRLSYYDTITGNDMALTLDHFDTRMDRFDPNTMQFHIRSVRGKGIAARVYQNKPLVEPVVAPDTAATTMPNLFLRNLELENIQLDYRNGVDALFAFVQFDNLETQMRTMDMAAMRVALDKVVLDGLDTKISMGKTSSGKKPQQEEKSDTDAATPNWNITVNDFRLTKSFVQFDDNNQPRLRYGMDYAHLDADDLSLHISNIFFNGDTISANVRDAQLKERSGLLLEQLQGDFLYTPTGASVEHLLVQTPGTRIQHTIKVSYPSLEAAQKQPELVKMQVVLPDSRIQHKDILLFAPMLRDQALLSNPNNVIRINAKISGSLKRIIAEELQLQAGSDTRVDLRGMLAGLPDMEQLVANLRIRLIRTTAKDIAGFLPKGAISASQLPDVMVLSGTIDGNQRQSAAALQLQTTSGDLIINGSVSNINNQQTAAYDAQVKATRIHAGKLSGTAGLGEVSASMHLQGKGLTSETANATLKALIHSIHYNNYTYHNIPIEGGISKQQANGHLSIVDSNLHMAADIQADLRTALPALQATINIDSIKTAPLHLTTQPVIYRGKIVANLPNINPDSLEGEVDILQSLLVLGGRDRVQLDTVNLTARHTSDSSSIVLTSDIGHAGIAGKYKLTELGTVFMNTVQPYFSIMDSVQADSVIQPYNFRVYAMLLDNPAVVALMPGIQQLQDLTLDAHFNSDSSWRATVTSPLIVAGGMRIEKLQVQAGAGHDSLRADIATGRLQVGGNALYGFTLHTGAANNQMEFHARFNDMSGVEKYRLAGYLKQPQFGVYTLSLSPEVLLNYESWATAPGNEIRVGDNMLQATNFMLNRNFQQFSLKTRGTTYNAPLEAYFSSFHLSTLTGFALSDSLDMNGTLDGQVLFSNVMTRPAFTGDLLITDLRFRNDTIGNVTIKASNSESGNIHGDIAVSGKGNDITISGDYFRQTTGGNDFDLAMNIRRLNLATLEGASGGSISNATGNVTGQFDISGTVAKPVVVGQLRLRQAGFNLTMLGNYFRIQDETIAFNRQGVRFDRFRITDSANNAAIIDGMVYTENLPDLRFDLTVNARNFQALNKEKAATAEDLYYGKLVFSSNMAIKGTAELPVVQGNITVEDATDLTIVLPQQNPGVVDREGIVQFVDMDAPENDSLFLNSMAKYDSLNRSYLQGMDISANVEIKKEAVFSMIVDQANGDFVRMRGEGLLTGGIDPSGYVSLSGSYEIQEGTYKLTFNLLQREFTIQEGSKIVWTGEPTEADLNVTAIYVVNTAPLDLVADQLGDGGSTAERNAYLQRMPFQVLLKMAGELLQPEVTFDIQLPDNENFRVSTDVISVVGTRLSQLRQEPNELNKQVFALLLLNRFVGDNPFQSSAGGLTAERVARQSASKLLTEQLNNLAANLVEGVDINFDVESYDDYSGGSASTRTDLNLDVSKQLLNDRLKVSVGSNFELEGSSNANENSSNLLGNVSVEYMLSKDGRYMLRAYRKNEYQGVLDGYIIETGVGFAITLDYNRFRNLFLSKKQREKRREERRRRNATEQAVAPTDQEKVPIPGRKGEK